MTARSREGENRKTIDDKKREKWKCSSRKEKESLLTAEERDDNFSFVLSKKKLFNENFFR